MKAWRTLLFIFSIIAVLAGMCAIFPEDGLKITESFNLHFPSLTDITGEDPAVIAAREEEKERAEAERRAIENDFSRFFSEAPTRFILPDGDPAFFDGFFASLDSARIRSVRIIHYGDSQIEMDRMTNVIRDSLQGRFGGMGPGLIPLRASYYSYSTAESVTGAFCRYACFGLDSAGRVSHRRYGPLCEMLQSSGDVSVTLSSKSSNKLRSRYFRQVSLVARNESSPMTLSCGSVSRTLPSERRTRVTDIVLKDSTDRIRLNISGTAELYGISLDDTTGVCVDNVGMRGCSGTVFARNAKEPLSCYCSDRNVRLVIYQFGGNAMPVIKSAKAAGRYASSLVPHLESIKSCAPDAKIIFVGPSDMSTMYHGKLQTYPMLQAVVDSLKAVSSVCGVAYWDLYSVMGGDGSMIEWKEARPQLAASDYIHFTNRGAALVGETFYASLMKYYDYYLWRKEKEVRR